MKKFKPALRLIWGTCENIYAPYPLEQTNWQQRTTEGIGLHPQLLIHSVEHCVLFNTLKNWILNSCRGCISLMRKHKEKILVFHCLDKHFWFLMLSFLLATTRFTLQNYFRATSALLEITSCTSWRSLVLLWWWGYLNQKKNLSGRKNTVLRSCHSYVNVVLNLIWFSNTTWSNNAFRQRLPKDFHENAPPLRRWDKFQFVWFFCAIKSP